MSFERKRIGIKFNWSLTVNPGYKGVEKFHDGINWYMMENKDSNSSISFKLKIENGNLASFNGQSITFRLSIKESFFYPIHAKDIKKVKILF